MPTLPRGGFLMRRVCATADGLPLAGPALPAAAGYPFHGFGHDA